MSESIVPETSLVSSLWLVTYLTPTPALPCDHRFLALNESLFLPGLCVLILSFLRISSKFCKHYVCFELSRTQMFWEISVWGVRRHHSIQVLAFFHSCVFWSAKGGSLWSFNLKPPCLLISRNVAVRQEKHEWLSIMMPKVLLQTTCFHKDI